MASSEPILPASYTPLHPDQSGHPNDPPRTSFSVSSAADDLERERRPSLHDAARAPKKKELGLLERLGLGSTARRTLGLCCLLVTVFLWTFANFLASSIFSDSTYDKPFLVVYVNSSVFAISLGFQTVRYVLRSGWAQCRTDARHAWQEYRTGVRATAHRTAEEYEEDLTAEEHLLADEEGSLEVFDPSTGGAAEPGEEKLTFVETTRLGLQFSLLWFLANYFASACLQYTSVGSVTILSSTSSVWTLIFCSLMKVDTFSARKLVGVLASLTGVVLISMVDLSGHSDSDRGSFPHKTLGEIAIGDAMAFFSAMVYGMYVTVMKRKVGDEDKVNMPLFFGLVGTFNLLLMWPLFPILHFTGMEPFQLPPTGSIWLVIAANSLSSFFSDISWAYAMLLTTPLVATVGLSLTIPLSLIGEMIQYNQYSSVLYWIGAAVVFVSFLFINHESKENGKESNKDVAAEADGS